VTLTFLRRFLCAMERTAASSDNVKSIADVVATVALFFTYSLSSFAKACVMMLYTRLNAPWQQQL